MSSLNEAFNTAQIIYGRIKTLLTLIHSQSKRERSLQQTSLYQEEILSLRIKLIQIYWYVVNLHNSIVEDVRMSKEIVNILGLDSTSQLYQLCKVEVLATTFLNIMHASLRGNGSLWLGC